ncbi:hypothetical protein [Janibacter anophelis]|uniref:hypothetical protein n=1 Tax=Janibacter anophelis TaxID=319054 RepID=UPI0013B06DBA|nr:hypothetical protein [Janibacter anophelis]
MPRRISPRHVTHSVDVATATLTRDGIARTTAAPFPVRCQVEHTVKLAATDDGPLVATVLTLRVPPLAAVDEVRLFAPHSPVTFRGDTSWVLSCAPVYRAGVHAYTQVLTGEQAALFGGGWPVTVTVHHGGGRDARGNPRPTVDTPDIPAVIVPKSTSDPTDWAEDPDAEATIHLPGGTALASTDEITVQDTFLAGRWRIDGLPTPDGPRIKAQIARTP